MSAAGVETFLARLYSEPALLDRFLADPDGAMHGHDLDPNDRAALMRIDRAGLRLAAASFGHKRAAKAADRHRKPWSTRVRAWLRS